MAEATARPRQDDVQLTVTRCNPDHNRRPAKQLSSPTMAASQPSAATGMGIRLDGGTAYSGAVITRYYDSLLDQSDRPAQTPRWRSPAWTARCASSVFAACHQYRLCREPAQAPDVPSNEYHTNSSTTRRTCFISQSAATARTKILTYIAISPSTAIPKPLAGAMPAATSNCHAPNFKRQSRHLAPAICWTTKARKRLPTG